MKKIWQVYSKHYDKVLLKFLTYLKLIKEVMDVFIKILTTYKRSSIKIIDLGCGSGNFSQAIVGLKKKFPNIKFEIIGVDLMEYSLHIAREKVGDHVKFYEGDLGQKGFAMSPENYRQLKDADIILINNLLYSLSPDKLKTLLLELKQLIREDGLMVISEPEKPSTFLEVTKYYISNFGMMKCLKFFISIIPLFYSFIVVIYINYKFLVKTIRPVEERNQLFTDIGFKLKEVIPIPSPAKAQ